MQKTPSTAIQRTDGYSEPRHVSAGLAQIFHQDTDQLVFPATLVSEGPFDVK